MSDEVLLVTGGKAYGGWTALEAPRSLETIAGSYTLTVTERWAGRQALAAISPGDVCSLMLGNDTVITGYVDDAEPEYDKGNHKVTIRGRDATGDLVDCSVVRNTDVFATSDPLAIAAEICQPFGISVRSEIALPAVRLFVLQYGETAFDALDRLCANVGALPTSDGQGGLVLTNAGMAGTRSSIALGRNIERARGKFSMRDRYSYYIVSGQSRAGDLTDPATAVADVGKATDPGVPRYRPIILQPNIELATPDLFQRRAEWESTVRFGRAWKADVTVPGWRDDSGALWIPNTLAPVDDDFLGIHDGALLISGVKYMLNQDGGKLATLTLTRREAFTVVPMPELTTYDPAPQQKRLLPPPAPDGRGRL